MPKSSAEPEVVEATIIDADISPLAGAERWLAQASERVAARCELYKPPKVIENEEQRATARDARTQVRKDAAEIDAERKKMLREIEDALKRFKTNVKDVLSPLTDLDNEYKALLDAYEASWKVSREIELAQEYDYIAPDLVELVPFKTLLERYGQKTGKVWNNRSTNIEAAKDMMADAVESIAEGERTIDELVDEEDREAIKARYFETLDLQGTIAEARRAKEQRERVRRLEEERRAREARARLEREERERRAAEEAARREAEEAARRQAEEDAWLEQAASAPVEPGHVRIVAPPSYADEATVIDNLDGAEPLVPEPVRIEPAPTMTEAPIAPPEPEQFEPAPVAYEPPRTIPPTEVPHPWVITIPSATKTQAQAVADFMRANGVAFERIYSGDMAQAYAKWRADNAR